VNVAEADFLTLKSTAARDKLATMELVADVQTGNAATTPDQVDTVYFVNPTGPVKKNSTITLKVYGPIVTPEAPSTAPTATPVTVAAAGTVTATWTAQSCPSGQTLSGYEVLVEGNGATVTSANPTTADVLTATITAGTGDFTVKYRFFCGQVQSAYSPAATVTVTPPAAG